MKSRTALALTALLVAMTGGAHACWPDFYDMDPKTMPTALFDVEVRRILGLPLQSEYPPAEPYSSASKYEDSRAADFADLEAALASEPNAADTVGGYKTLREALTTHIGANLITMDLYRRHEAARPAPMDLSPYETTLASLPEEFVLYFRGAAAYHQSDWEQAAKWFKAVLDLAPEARHYRSTWAAYMLGRTAMQSESGDAEAYFALTRKLAEEGFADSVGLAAASAGWEARNALDQGRYLEALHLYAASPDEALRSLRTVCSAALAKEPVDEGLITDPLARQIISAWLVAHPDEEIKASTWLMALDKANLEGTVEGAEYLAWLSYNGGNMESAKAWLAHADPASPYSRWIQAKLLLRDGKLEEGENLLAELGDTFPSISGWLVQNPHDNYIYRPFHASSQVLEDLGETRIARGEYSAALCAFMRADDWEDASFLAERVLTTEELRNFVDTHDQNPELIAEKIDYPYDRREPGWKREELRYLLARRYAREGAWDKAIPFYPDYPENPYLWLDWETAKNQPLPPLAKLAQYHYECAHTASLPPRTRAEHMVELGMLLRRKGAELLSPELIPPPGTDTAQDTWPKPTPDMQKRIDAAMKVYPFINYYREMAAGCMWEAAKLLPNNDVLCATALYYGGRFIKGPDPDKADLFYKALVRRNPNLLIAKQADEERWFPNEFTDLVLYQPYPPRTPDPWYGRKLYLAIGVAVILGLDAMAMLVYFAVKRRRAATGPPG